MDIRQVRLDLKWIGVGFLDLAIVLRVVWECRCDPKHQLMLETSYLVMETHANSTPVHCPNVCYLHVLTKGQGKEAWALPKKLAKAVDDYLAKEGCLEDLFFKQILRNYQPCVSTPKTPEQHKECVNQKNTVYLNSCPILYPATYEEHPMNNHGPDRVLFWKSLKKFINSYTLDLGWDDIERHLLELLKPETYINLQR